MSYKLQQVANDLAEAIATLQADATEHARHALLDSRETLIRETFAGDYDISTGIAGIDWNIEEGDAPLTLYILDLVGEEAILHKADPIGELIEGTKTIAGEVIPLEDTDRTTIHRAIAALQSGIDRLRAHEAECDKAQP